MGQLVSVGASSCPADALRTELPQLVAAIAKNPKQTSRVTPAGEQHARHIRAQRHGAPAPTWLSEQQMPAVATGGLALEDADVI
jgi:hypothetical protein